jgi:hypothetical protein
MLENERADLKIAVSKHLPALAANVINELVPEHFDMAVLRQELKIEIFPGTEIAGVAASGQSDINFLVKSCDSRPIN